MNTGRKDYPVSKITDPELGKIKNISPSEYCSLMWEQTKTLFSKSYLRITVILCYLQFGSSWLYMTMILFFPKILQDTIMYADLRPNEHSLTICGIENYFAKNSNLTVVHECVDKMAFESFGYPMISEVSITVGFFLVALLVKYFGMWTLSSEFISSCNFILILYRFFRYNFPNFCYWIHRPII
jgi:hypothetical protein